MTMKRGHRDEPRAWRAARPLAGVVEKVAEHLVEILAIDAYAQILGDSHVDRDAALGVQTQKSPRQALRRGQH